MITTTKDRDKWSTHFWEFYEQLCAMRNVGPVRGVMRSIKRRVLELNLDYLSSGELEPILRALEVNKNLRIVIFKSSNSCNTKQGRFL